ncbi:heat-inducible transcriptional repressor HrcA [Anaeromyxobacter diazotrophicus]|uniref:Heat-inducible transcription repressor HrcA n=1 Tax=Anaeromyxobacter diazotrophicus TaxID=2590199 RepID=A0A7I9VNF6_9BACT|nr:heat-inducible transcriptional repressor HrcA [Anaeromyxobacter diazotrophicus]GEJ57659.1 heat-inducible transcription repressor HrcA [Anaeromyxobacter diazotrophicus]
MASETSSLSQRAREILRVLVQDYIHTGEPVASQPLLARHELDCSPATVRNVMADLEALGFLTKPHASSGRIPTQAGYRLYVDALLKIRPPPLAEREQIEKVAHDPAAVDTLLESTARVLHSLTHHAGVVTTPRPVDDPIRQVEFVRLRESRVLVVFVSEAGLVTNKLMQLDAPAAAGELERAANYLNEKLRDGPLATLRDRILADMREDQGALQGLVAKALALAERSFGAASLAGGEVLVDGEESFLDAPEFADVQKARALLRAFAEKDRILRVLDKVLRAREVQIFIGAESELASVPDVSVVAAPYGRGDQVLGTLAVIGPTRMKYERVIPLVALTAREISRALSGGEEP